MKKRLTAPDILALKGQRKLAVITASDYPSAMLADQAGADMILIGDSLAMVALGYEDTLSVSLDEMIHHTRAAARGLKESGGQALLIGDMPFMSYQVSVEQAVASAGRFLAEGGARAVKMEGGRAFAPQVEAMVRAGIPVMSHIGLTPQYVANLGGFKAQGKTAEAVRILLDDAQALARAGSFALVLEAMPAEAAAFITERVSIPTIGIGAGPDCDGQVLVQHDLLGLFDRFTPRFVKRYAEIGKASREALGKFCDEIRSGAFPAEEHTTHLAEEEARDLSSDKTPGPDDNA